MTTGPNLGLNETSKRTKSIRIPKEEISLGSYVPTAKEETPIETHAAKEEIDITLHIKDKNLIRINLKDKGSVIPSSNLNRSKKMSKLCKIKGYGDQPCVVMSGTSGRGSS